MKNTAQIQQEKILVIASKFTDFDLLSASLESSAMQANFEESNFQNILFLVDKFRPTLLMIYAEQLDVELHLQLEALQQHFPLPVILQLIKELDGDIERCLNAGVSVFLSGAVNYERMPSIVNTAMIRYQQSMQSQQYTEKLEQQLQQRKVIAKAKGLLMENNNLTENEAYEFLRTTAMQRNQTMADLADKIIKRYQ